MGKKTFLSLESMAIIFLAIFVAIRIGNMYLLGVVFDPSGSSSSHTAPMKEKFQVNAPSSNGQIQINLKELSSNLL